MVAVLFKSWFATLLVVTIPMTLIVSSSNSFKLSVFEKIENEISVFALLGSVVQLMVKLSENEV